MKWLLVALCAVLAGCASNDAGTVLIGTDYGVEFSIEENTRALEIECAPPSIRVAGEWVDECNAIARRFLGSLVASGRISDFPDPAFGQAGRAMKSIWAGLVKNDGAIEGSGTKVAGFQLRREMEWEELQ
jgi:hypothetical protein